MYYLLIKEHNQTGLKYLCFHKGTKESCFKYCGSGKYWKRHLKKHGKNLTTRILIETDSHEELKIFGIAYSKLYDVIKSKHWANLCLENGVGGSTGLKTLEARRKMSIKKIGKPLSEEHKRKIGLSVKGPKNGFYGKLHSLETKEKNKLWHLGKYNGDKNPHWKGGISKEYKKKLVNTVV